MAAVFLSVVGCTLPLPNQGKSGNNTNISLPTPSPTPSPSPTATQQFAASAPSFHIGEVGVGYSPVAITATGGAQPYHYALGSGALPPGLNLATDGSVGGMPTSAGTFSFSIDVTDSGDGKAPVAGSITIASALGASLIPACAKYCNVELGCVAVCGKFGTQTGGVGPFTYALSQGQLPSGTSLNALSLTGTFTGLTGYLRFTVQVTDSLEATATVSPTFWMYQHISLGSDNNSCYRVFTDCSLKLPISGGVPNGHPSVALVSEASTPQQGCWYGPQPLPAGYTLGVSGGFVNLYIPRSQNTGGYGGVWTLVLTDHTPCSVGQDCTAPSATATIGIECT